VASRARTIQPEQFADSDVLHGTVRLTFDPATITENRLAQILQSILGSRSLFEIDGQRVFPLWDSTVGRYTGKYQVILLEPAESARWKDGDLSWTPQFEVKPMGKDPRRAWFKFERVK
jgi:hypothetical protein